MSVRSSGRRPLESKNIFSACNASATSPNVGEASKRSSGNMPITLSPAASASALVPSARRAGTRFKITAGSPASVVRQNAAISSAGKAASATTSARSAPVPGSPAAASAIVTWAVSAEPEIVAKSALSAAAFASSPSRDRAAVLPSALRRCASAAAMVVLPERGVGASKTKAGMTW